jgi:hypothetical protein
MSDNLSNFLVDLASDPDRLARFFSNPLGELNDSPLTSEERRMVISRDGGELQRELRLQKTNGSLSGGGGKKKGPRKGAKKGAKKGARKKAPGRKK